MNIDTLRSTVLFRAVRASAGTPMFIDLRITNFVFVKELRCPYQLHRARK